MSVNIEIDLKDLLIKIDSRLERIEERLTKVEIGQIRLEESLTGQIKTLDERLSGKITSLDERLSGRIDTLEVKIDGLDKRVENQEFTNRGVLIGLIIAITGGAAKLFGFFPNS